MTNQFSGMSYVELTDHITEAVAGLKRKAYGEGYAQGRFDERAVYADRFSQPLTRAEVVRKAKADIEALKNENKLYDYGIFQVETEFIVNNEKRTIVVLARGISTGLIRNKGIAKCAPGDCFNESIGKAVALRRALGLEVPSEYTNAPEPANIEVGDVVYRRGLNTHGVRTLTEKLNERYFETKEAVGSTHIKNIEKVIDDSARNYSEKVAY